MRHTVYPKQSVAAFLPLYLTGHSAPAFETKHVLHSYPLQRLQMMIWKVSIARPRYRARNFDVLYIFTSKFFESRARSFQTFYSTQCKLRATINPVSL